MPRPLLPLLVRIVWDCTRRRRVAADGAMVGRALPQQEERSRLKAVRPGCPASALVGLPSVWRSTQQGEVTGERVGPFRGWSWSQTGERETR